MSVRRGERPGVAQRRQLRERFLQQLGQDERLVAEGRLRGWNYIMVTDRRMIWTEGRGLVSLPFSWVVQAREIFEETHRYRMKLIHEPIDREPDTPLPWDIPHHIRRLRARRSWNRATEFGFSRADTEVAKAMRQALSRAEVPFATAEVRPHRRDKPVRILYRMGPVRAWWHRWRFSGLD